MKKLKFILSTLLVLILVSSCDDFLSEMPDNRIEVNTTEKLSELLVSAYPNASYFEMAETMSDNVFDTGKASTDTKNLQSYNWEMQTDTNYDTQTFYWNACYSAIAHANEALEIIDQLGNSTKLNSQRGEALLARAYSHFMLVAFWSKRYNPDTASTDLGIPYVKESEKSLVKKYRRNTIAEVFDFIQNDITEGLKFVTDDYAQPKYHFNKEAAKAFACRFYLIKGDWDKVIEFSNDLGVRPVGKLRDYFAFRNSNIEEAMAGYSGSDKQSNLLVAYPNSSYGYSNSRFYLSGVASDKLFSDKNIFNKRWLYFMTSSDGGETKGGTKFGNYFQYSNITAGIGEPYLGSVLFSNDELFLNRIEAHIMKNQIALANDELEYFLSTRIFGYDEAEDRLTIERVVTQYPFVKDEYTPFYSITQEQTSYIKAIAEARRRDFIQEGVRWFDIKRFNIEVKHEFDILSGLPANVLKKDDNRRAVQIPLQASSLGLEKNPR